MRSPISVSVDHPHHQPEADRLRDEVIRRMANTPPKPKPKLETKKERKLKPDKH
jgi:hypothetical protein